MTDLSFNIVNALGASASFKKETPNKSVDEVPPQMEPAEDRDSEAQMQTHGTTSQQLSESKEHSVQQQKTKGNQVITENQPSSQRSSSKCAMLKPSHTILGNNLKICFFFNRLAMILLLNVT